MHISAYEARLERVAEELMGRRKWKQFQELHTKSHMNTESKTTTTPITITEEENLATETINEVDRQNSTAEQITHSETNLLESLESEHMQKEQIHIVTKKDDKDKDTYEDEEHHKESSQNQQAELEKDKNKIEHKTEKETNRAGGELADIETAPHEVPTIESNNNKGEPESSNITTIRNSERLKSVESPPPAEPIDWKPDDKCHFCINGKLLTVNDKGELVAESGPAMSETEAQRLDTDSDSDVSSNQGGSVNAAEGDNRRIDFTKLLTSRQRQFPENMASLNSLAPPLASNFPLFQNLNWLQLAQQTAQQTTQQLNSATPTTSDILAAALSPSSKDSPSPSDATGEQPLDLSSKPSPNSSLCGDLKAIRPKSSRSTPLSAGRRTYSDEDLNNALQDVLSGKSGTRKAAVRYSVPRSTLRNQMKALQNPLQQMEVDNSDDDGENDAASSASVQQTNEAEQSFDESSFRMTLLKKITENNGDPNAYSNASGSTGKNSNANNKLQNNTASLLTEAIAQGTPAALVQTLVLLASNTSGLDDRVSVRDLISAMLVNTGGAGLKASTDASDAQAENANMNNGRNANFLAHKLLFQQLQQESQQQRTSPYATTTRLATSDTPETNSSSMDANDDDQSSILKIPSYKPVAGSTGTHEPSVSPSPTLVNHNNNNNNSLNSNLHRNGDSPQSALSPRMQTSLLAANLNATNSTCPSNISVISPPLPSHHSLGSADSQSPPLMRFRDMIVNTIHRTMNDPASKETQGDYKKPSISVVKNIGGTDTSRFGAVPNVLDPVGAGSGSLHHNHQQSQYHMHSHHSSHHLSRAEAAALAAGKGTRPKRGKYRNYDRDSLVEAVKAVQRGEMSVHRAGSYYGVPHSTLEYKVKERHLMRPRKREPKPQPGLDGSNSSASTSKSNSNIPGLQNSYDKMKAGVAAAANSSLKQLNSVLKNNSNNALNYTSGSQNGMKLPLFDANTMAQLPYPFLWQQTSPAAFHQLQIDINRNAAAAVAAAAQNSVAHMQRFRDETAMSGGNANSPSPDTSPMSGSQNHHQFTPETLYEGAGTNGSFLDGIIRKSLDRKAGVDLASHSATNANNASSGGSGSSGALLDQLVKNTPLPFTNNRGVNDFTTNVAASGAAAAFGTAFPVAAGVATGGIKRSSSPPAFPGIKRERSSPPPPPTTLPPTTLKMQASSDDEDTTRNITHKMLLEHNNNNKKNSSNGNGNGNGRINHGSDSDNDIVAMTGLEHTTSSSSHNTHSTNHKSRTEDLNGGNDAAGATTAAMPKTKSATSTLLTQTETKAINNAGAVPPTTSILQEKLAQIKSEQGEGDINL